MGLILISLIASLAGIAIFIYFLKKGEFDNSEDVKYQLFREEDSIKRVNEQKQGGEKCHDLEIH
jgi:hypothetical protein